MENHIVPEFTIVNALAAVGIAAVYILASSLIPEPNRQKFSAIMVAGAGAVYLNAGLGPWEFLFCAVMTYVAFRGLGNYTWIGIGWLLHTGWDVLHHLYGNPIVSISPSSSAGCAICDTLLAIWFFWQAPSLFERLKSRQINTLKV
jgi:hypothetical protein